MNQENFVLIAQILLVVGWLVVSYIDVLLRTARIRLNIQKRVIKDTEDTTSKKYDWNLVLGHVSAEVRPILRSK